MTAQIGVVAPQLVAVAVITLPKIPGIRQRIIRSLDQESRYWVGINSRLSAARDPV